jgi:AraC-like DNA-binding protein
MAAILKRISETVIIPKTCRERFLPLQHPALAVLREMGISGCGLSDLRHPYRIARVRCRFHVAIFTIAGRGAFETESSRGRFAPGELWSAGCGQTYCYWTKQSWRAVWFHLADSARWAGLRARGIHQGASAASAAGAKMWGLVEGILTEAARNEHDVERSIRAYAELVSVLLDRELAAVAENSAQAAIRRRLNALWERIDGALQHKWTIAELASQLQLSPVHFHRIVLEQCGATPMQIVTRLRMRRAEAMLRNPDYKLSAIASALGYETPFALSRAFKRSTGRSPRGRAPK